MSGLMDAAGPVDGNSAAHTALDSRGAAAHSAHRPTTPVKIFVMRFFVDMSSQLMYQMELTFG